MQELSKESTETIDAGRNSQGSQLIGDIESINNFKWNSQHKIQSNARKNSHISWLLMDKQSTDGPWMKSSL